jgi:hypothetical protein
MAAIVSSLHHLFSTVALDISHASGAMAAIIKILTALINDIGRATRDTLVWLPTK